MLIEQSTKDNKKLVLNIAFNYGGMQDILNAAKNCPKNKLTLNNFSKYLLTNNTPNVDLLIRTGNEKRISNFLL
jgi:undecaprenyl diphosphate synthase